MTTDLDLSLVYKMEKRDHLPKDFYKSLEVPVDFLVDRSWCEKKQTFWASFQAERVVAKKRNPFRFKFSRLSVQTCRDSQTAFRLFEDRKLDL